MWPAAHLCPPARCEHGALREGVPLRNTRFAEADLRTASTGRKVAHRLAYPPLGHGVTAVPRPAPFIKHGTLAKTSSACPGAQQGGLLHLLGMLVFHFFEVQSRDRARIHHGKPQPDLGALHAGDCGICVLAGALTRDTDGRGRTPRHR